MPSDCPFTRGAADAAQGDSRAAPNLGLAYEWGKAVPKDPEKSDRYMKMAADAGLAEAQSQMAIRASDRGDYTGAREWNEKAAAQKEPQALYNLAMLCEDD